jgi:hypothetical protein
MIHNGQKQDDASLHYRICPKVTTDYSEFIDLLAYFALSFKINRQVF